MCVCVSACLAIWCVNVSVCVSACLAIWCLYGRVFAYAFVVCMCVCVMWRFGVCMGVCLHLRLLCVCVCVCDVCISVTVKYEIVTYSVQNYTGSADKSQNIVEQANSNPNNTSLTMSSRHIICNSSILTEWTSRLTPNKTRIYSKVEAEKYNESKESQILAVFPT